MDRQKANGTRRYYLESDGRPFITRGQMDLLLASVRDYTPVPNLAKGYLRCSKTGEGGNAWELLTWRLLMRAPPMRGAHHKGSPGSRRKGKQLPDTRRELPKPRLCANMRGTPEASAPPLQSNNSRSQSGGASAWGGRVHGVGGSSCRGAPFLAFPEREGGMPSCREGERRKVPPPQQKTIVGWLGEAQEMFSPACQ